MPNAIIPAYFAAPSELWLFAAIIALQIADTVTTLLGLKAGAVEGNPLMRWAFARTGNPLAVLVVSKALAVWALWYFAPAWPSGMPMLAIVIVMYALIVASNLRNIVDLTRTGG